MNHVVGFLIVTVGVGIIMIGPWEVELWSPKRSAREILTEMRSYSTAEPEPELEAVASILSIR